MGDSMLNSFFGIILGVFLLFIGPIYDSYNTTDKLVDNIVNDSVNNFQKETRKNGYLDTETYIDFLNNLNKTGRVYDVQFIHTSRLVYPNQTSSDYEIHEFQYGEKYILETIKNNEQYYMRYGDDFKVIVKEREVAPSRRLLSILSSEDKERLVMFTSGGMVENEVME